MKKTYKLKPTPSEEGRLVAAEIYAAPPPPTKGRVIGLDCHPDTYTAAVFRGSTPHDARKLTSRENLCLQSLMDWSAKEFTREDLFLLEAGSNSFEICRRLQALGLRAVVMESCHVGKHAKTYADNDKMAAARIALVYLAGNAPCVWIPDAVTCERRELLHVYQNAVANHTAALNSLKSYLNQFAIRTGKRGLQLERTREWILAQRDWTLLQKELLDGYFTNLDNQAEARARFLRLISEQICAEPLMLRCMKLLGIGKINAFALLAVIGDVRRFDRPEKLVAYIGLNPGRRQSGNGKDIKLGIGKRGRGDIRHLLIQGAQAVLAPLVRNSPASQLEGFAICGEDKKWVWADAKIQGKTVVVSSDKVLAPVAVRYAWADNPTCNLYNNAGFPASPFRTDDFPPITINGKY